MKPLAIAIVTVALIGSVLGCGQDSPQAVTRGALDRVVPRLPRGLSIDEVEELLGEPRARFEGEGGEIVLNYEPWLLVFKPSLYERTRNYPSGYWPRKRPVAPLDRRVRALRLGSSRRTVERELGRTETWQILIRGKDESVWYGNGRWKLQFLDGRLSRRTLFS